MQSFPLPTGGDCFDERGPMSSTAPTAAAPVSAAEEAGLDIMQRLRAGTASIHAQTERLPLMAALLDPAVTPADYTSYLQAVHGIYAVVEPALYAALPPHLPSRLGVRPKLPALQRDIAALGLDARVPRDGRASPPRGIVDGEAAALGGLYVLEGATLGGRVIATRLQRALGPQMGLPLAFLNFHGTEAGPAWRRFSAAMSDWSAQNPGSDDAVVAGAMRVFGAVHRALAEDGRATPAGCPKRRARGSSR
jgi:heme oxygenase